MTFMRVTQRRALTAMLRLRGSERAIAGGLAIGFAVAFTPTMGFQLIMAAVLATLIGVSRPASLIPVWITNPATMGPIYAFAYKLGRLFWTGPPAHKVDQFMESLPARLEGYKLLALNQRFNEFLKVGVDAYICMWIGGLLMGGVSAALAYPVALRFIRRFNAARARRKARRQQKRRLARTG